MSRKKIQRRYSTSELRGLAVISSYDTKNKIDQFLINSYACSKHTIPLIINGLHLFSIYVYDRRPTNLYMLIITKYGARRIKTICEKYFTIEEIYKILRKYFSLVINDEIPDKKNILNLVIPTLANHYYLRGNCESSPYNENYLSQRCMSILYPLNIKEVPIISLMLTKITIAKEDSIEKEQLRCT